MTRDPTLFFVCASFYFRCLDAVAYKKTLSAPVKPSTSAMLHLEFIIHQSADEWLWPEHKMQVGKKRKALASLPISAPGVDSCLSALRLPGGAPVAETCHEDRRIVLQKRKRGEDGCVE